mgnify:CR=1 FL=1
MPKNSPRSKSAIELLGIDEKELYYINFDEFIKLHPELIKYDESYQLKIYNHMEERRKKNIENAIKKRKELIDNSLENKQLDITLKNNPSSLTLKEINFSLIDEEKEKLRQMLILKNKINYELKLSEKEKRNKEKYLSLERNIDEIKQFRQKIKQDKILKQQLSDMQRKERLKLDYEEYLKYQNEIKEREQRIELNVEKTQREKIEENEIRKKLSRQKEDEFRLKLEQKNILELENINNKRKKIRLKYDIHKKNLEDIKKEKETENQEKLKYTEEKTIKAINTISELETNNYNYMKNKMNLRQESVKENLKKLNNEKNVKFKESDTLFVEKEKNICNLFKKYEFDIKRKEEEYNKKYLNISLRKKEIDSKTKQNLRIRNLILQQKGNKCKEARLKEEKQKELYRKRLFEKINTSQSQMTMRRQKNNMELKEKFADLSIKMEDISQNLKRQERLFELQKIKKLAKFEEKNKRLEKMRYIRLKLQNQRRQINKNLEIDKERLMNKYSLLKLNENKSKEEILKELFPEDYNSGRSPDIFGKSIP